MTKRNENSHYLWLERNTCLASSQSLNPIFSRTWNLQNIFFAKSRLFSTFHCFLIFRTLKRKNNWGIFLLPCFPNFLFIFILSRTRMVWKGSFKNLTFFFFFPGMETFSEMLERYLRRLAVIEWDWTDEYHYVYS